MSNLRICRICLRTECKMYRYDRYQLKSYYEEVLALKVNEYENLPRYFCYECATILQKFHKFKEKCYLGQQTLKEISWRAPITYEAVYKIDRKAKNLTSPIEILTTARKRVKTYNEASSSDDSGDSDDDSKSESDVETPEVKVNDAVNVTEQNSSRDSETNSIIIIIKNDTERPIEAIDTNLSDDCVMNDDHIYPESDPVHENKIGNDNQSEPKIFENVKTEHILPLKPKPPETVFVSENVSSILRKELQKKTRTRNVQKKKKVVQREPKFVKKPMLPKKLYVDLLPENWKKTSLSEEEALERFRKRAEDPKYMKASYKCSDCFKGFSKEEMLKRHHVLRHAESIGAVECRFCKMRFKWECTLRQHMREHYAKFECLHCGLVCVREQSAMLHDWYHSGRKKICVHCGSEFKHLSTYYTHLRTHRSTHICTLCGASFVSPLGLRLHKKVKHVDGENDSPDEDAPVDTYCATCAINFETRKAYEEHLFHSAMHSNEIVEESATEAVTPSLVTASKKVLAKTLKTKFTDELNGKITKIDVAPERKRMRHRRQVERFRRKPTTCYQCGKHFETQSACMKHHLAEHPGTSFCPPSQRYICELCGASLAPGSIATHQNMHRREKTHPCETCGRIFYSSVVLKQHLVTHTGEKPYPCKLCDKRFTQNSSMKLHYRTFHLKQPYPKRNRRKKNDDRPAAARRSMSTSDSGSQSAPEAAPQYATLTTGPFAVTML